MPAKYFNFVDGQRLPGDRVKEFLMNQAVVQCENQTEITGSGIEALGARVALNLEDGQIWTYGGEPAAWAPAQNALDLDLLDARYLTRLAADGLYLTEIQADGKYLTDGQAAQKYLTILTAQGLYITEGEADGKYLTPAQANNLYLTPLDADSRYITLVSAGQIYLRKDDATTIYQSKPSSGTFITDIQAGSIYLSQTDASNTYISQLNAGNLFISKGGAAGDINANNTTIDGGKITTNSLHANRIAAGTLSADQIALGTLSGRSVQTGSSGKRILMSGVSGSIVVYDDNGEVGRIQGGVAGSTGMSIGGTNSARIDIGIASTVFQGNISTANGAGITSTGSLARSQLIGGGTTGASINTSGNFIRTSSSQRYKQDISNLEIDYQDILSLQPKKFRRIEEVEEDENAKLYPGFIAEDLAGTALDIFVFYSEDEEGNLIPEGIHYAELTAALVSAIKEQDSRLSALEARLAALEGGNS